MTPLSVSVRWVTRGRWNWQRRLGAWWLARAGEREYRDDHNTERKP